MGIMQPHPYGQKRSKPYQKRFLLLFAAGLLVLGGVIAFYIIQQDSHSIVPTQIRSAVPFSVYYPGAVPSGYSLNSQSFRLADAGVVVFSVNRSDSKTILFSEQAQPSSNDMNTFISGYIPLNSVLQVPLGQAKFGAYGNAPDIRTVVSLPIANGPWLIVTAPADTNHDDLVALIRSLKQ
jgi:hypothetical protein